MKEILGAILSLLIEFKKDTKTASILIIFGLLIGSLYVIYIQVEEKNNISKAWGIELRDCERQRIIEIRETSLKFERMAVKMDSLRHLTKKK